MKEYILEIIISVLILWLLENFSTTAKNKNTIKYISSIILLSMIVIPVISFVRDFELDSINFNIDTIQENYYQQYEEYIEENAYDLIEKQIKIYLTNNFYIKDSDVEIFFNLNDKEISEINIILKGKSKLINQTKIEESIENDFLTKCTVIWS